MKGKLQGVKRGGKAVDMKERRRDERQSWRLFSCLLGMGRVTWATPTLLPKYKKRQEKRGRDGVRWGRVMGNRSEELKRFWIMQRNGEEKRLSKENDRPLSYLGK